MEDRSLTKSSSTVLMKSYSNMNKRLFLGIVGVILSGVSVPMLAYADFDLGSWKFQKEIKVPTITTPAYVKVVLDKEALNGSSFQNDIRIISKDGRETPYQLVHETGSVSGGYYSTKMLDLSTASGETMFIVDLDASGLIHNQIRINTSSRNFKKQVSVYASDVLLGHGDAKWRLLTDSGYIFNFTDERASFVANGDTVLYPRSTARYVRVVIGEGEGGVTSVSGASVYRSEVNAGEEQVSRYPLLVTQNPNEKSTEMTVDFGAQGTYSREITLATTDTNFSRRAVIQSSADGLSWRRISEGSVSSISLKSFTGSQLTLTYPESQERFLRVIVFNYDDQPVRFADHADVRSTIRAIVFEAKPYSQYSVYYGNNKAGSPQYDFARFFNYVDTNDFIRAELGGQVSNTSFVPPPQPVVPFTEKYPYLLNVTLVILVIIIGAFLFFYLRSVTKGHAKIEENNGVNSAPEGDR